MKNNINSKFYLIAMCFAVLLSFGVNVSAIEVGANVNVNVGVGVSNATATANMSATGTAASSQNSGGSQGDENRSEVSAVVRSLLSIALRDGGIGADVRLVAQEQASTTAQVKESMAEVSADNGLKIFLFGPDYKNLGKLRSAIVTTENHIERLRMAQARTTSASVKADLEVQINVLEGTASSTQAFVDENEDQLSILGWFVRIFSE